MSIATVSEDIYENITLYYSSCMEWYVVEVYIIIFACNKGSVIEWLYIIHLFTSVAEL